MEMEPEAKMDFQNSNRFNVLTNMLSTNMLPLTHEKTSMSIFLKVYMIMVWTIELIYLAVCIRGFWYVPKERALQDSTVNIVVSIESILMIIYLSNRKNMLRRLIGKVNNILTTDNETFKNTITQTLKLLEKPLKIYTIVSISTVIIWIMLPCIQIFKKDEFYYVDYRIPAVLAKEPFSVSIFIVGMILETFGSAYVIFRKVSLDIYTIHLILLMTAQYRYLRIKFQTIFRTELVTLEGANKNDTWENICRRNKKTIKQELRLLTRHHALVVE